MKESSLVKRFNLELDKINSMTNESNDEPTLSIPLEEEGAQKELSPIIKLAETMAETDYSGESHIKESLLQRLLQKVQEPKSDSKNNKPNQISELSNEELDRVAGGLISQQMNAGGCSLCACRWPSEIIDNEFCENCGHPRAEHK